ncbi:MAG: rhomboid family intramembrane serine protease [Oligoflexia bacterium]|nr:rhomboid family intramembrane serine protease [Oligoflexia bacterium]MBF0365265.1 rhomboid family intramembrane serine protease [Oligoflexia bacterium]
MYNTNIPTLSLTNKVIIIVSGVCLILQSILSLTGAGIGLQTYFGLSYNGILGGHLYQLLLYPFFQSDLIGFIFNALILWMMGSEFEQQWGRPFYAAMLGFSTLLAALVYLGVVALFFANDALARQIPMMGLTGLSSAILVIYSVLYGERILSFMLLFPMKAKYFCWILLGMELYIGIFSRHARSSWGHLGAMLGGFLFIMFAPKLRVLMNRHGFGGGGRGGGRTLSNRGSSTKESHLRLVKPQADEERLSDDNTPKYWQ